MPFLLILVNSFKSPADYANGGPLSLPTRSTSTASSTSGTACSFPTKLWNSFFIAGWWPCFAVVISVLQRLRASASAGCKGRTWIIVLFLIANMLPQEALLYPLYFMFKQVGLYDNVWASSSSSP